MTIAIVACPKCSTLLLNETVQCHRCRFILRPELAGHLKEASLPSDAAVQAGLETCRQCGETYRNGLVRCWSCGSFTRPEIEEAYYRMVRDHADQLELARKHLPLPEITEEEARNTYWTHDDPTHAEDTDQFQSLPPIADDDFVLTGDYTLQDSLEIPEIPYLAPLGAPPTPAGDIPTLNLEAPLELSVPLEEPPPLAAELAGQTLEMETFDEPADENAAEIPNLAPVDSDDELDSTPAPDDATVLMNIAKQEESATLKSRFAKTSVGTFVVYCPMGCKIRVHERHRGKVGRCPKCQATFVVPMARQMSLSGSTPTFSMGDSTVEMAALGAGLAATKYAAWIEDVHLHRIAPEKLRIKADSLLKDFQEVDVGFDPEGLLLVGLQKPGGMFGGKGPKKKEDARALVRDHLAKNPTLDGLPSSFKQDISSDLISQISLTQPTPPGVESLFGNILVFGAGRIAVKLPKLDDKTNAYLSFTLSQFREFARLLESVFGISGFGEGAGVPLKDEYQTNGCQISKSIVKELQHLSYYQKDPAIKLEISGYKCKVCGAVISETARATQKIGGANGKGIAKAKCPKCTKPMGNVPLYTAPVPVVAASSETADAESPTEAAPATTA